MDKVVSAVSHRGEILVFTEQGRIYLIRYDGHVSSLSIIALSQIDLVPR